MKGKILYIGIGAVTLCALIAAVVIVIVSKQKTNKVEVPEVKVAENAYIGETSSGDVVINLDDEGNPVEMIDANGEVIDLTEEGVQVEKDENGEIVSVTTADGETVVLKEKADEENSKDIVKKAEETQQKKAEEQKKAEGKSEKTTEKTSEEKKSETPASSEKTSEEKKAEGNKLPTELPEADKDDGKDWNETAMSATMYAKEDKSLTAILVYLGPGEKYGSVMDNESAAKIYPYPLGKTPISVKAKTDNNWYRVVYSSTQAKNAWDTAEPHSVEGYVKASDLMSAEKFAELQKASELPSEEPSEKPSEQPSEKPSETPSETPSEDPKPEEKTPDEIPLPADALPTEQEGVYYTITVHTNPEHLAQVNALRKEAGVPELTWNSAQEAAVMQRIKQMYIDLNGGIDHSYGGGSLGVRENLTVLNPAVDAYKNSPVHYNNMIASDIASMVSASVDIVIYYQNGRQYGIDDRVVYDNNRNNIMCFFN